MYELLLAVAIVLLAVIKARERFALVIGGDSFLSTKAHSGRGWEIFSLYPNTCKGTQELDAGLCYPRCKPGFHGVGPVCWADTVNVGVGVPVGLEPCPAGWVNDGLTCRQPIRCATGWDFFKYGCSGGRVVGRLNSGGICDWPQDRGNLPGHLVDKSDPKNFKATHPDKVDGLCYKKCPPELPARVPGMPYLCYKGEGLSYGRGVGTVPGFVRVLSRGSPSEVWSYFFPPAGRAPPKKEEPTSPLTITGIVLGGPMLFILGAMAVAYVKRRLSSPPPATL